jgi:hypothetical protein
MVGILRLWKIIPCSLSLGLCAGQNFIVLYNRDICRDNCLQEELDPGEQPVGSGICSALSYSALSGSLNLCQISCGSRGFMSFLLMTSGAEKPFIRRTRLASPRAVSYWHEVSAQQECVGTFSKVVRVSSHCALRVRERRGLVYSQDTESPAKRSGSWVGSTMDVDTDTHVLVSCGHPCFQYWTPSFPPAHSLTQWQVWLWFLA